MAVIDARTSGSSGGGGESEVSKGGMTLSGSGTCSGWVYAYAKDSLTADPGWVNCSYTSANEFLRVDLGSSHNVSHVAYEPRVMQNDGGAGGTWNGVYKNYAIYVTDDASDNPSNWGTPVATGTWTWPNLQERKDVTFTPKAGRYVYFFRVSGYGWWTELGNPGYAGANEIWVYEQSGGGGGSLVHSYYHADGNGNVTCMLDNNQSIVASYKYDPYGRTISSSGSLAAANVYRFSSKEIHANSGMYYYLYRFYDPNTQRWLNRDPLGEIASKNLYAFTANSPTARVDRDGYRWFPTGRLPTDKDSTVICRNGKPEPRVVVNYTPLEVLTLLPNYSDQKGYYCALKCSVQHEKSHISDIVAQNPNICVGVANGTTIASNDPNTELLNSEQKAHQVSAECLAKCAKQCPSDYINQQQQKNQDWINSHLYE